MAVVIWRQGEGFSGDPHWSAEADPAPSPTLRARWSISEGVLQVEADRLGAMPVYLGTGEGVAAIGDDLVEVAAVVSARIDDDALAVFLQLGYFPENDTMFGGVRKLAPSERLRIDESGLSIDRAAETTPPPARSGLSRAQVVADLRDASAAAIERRLPDRGTTYALPLSGGRDSRHIALQSMLSGRAPDLVATHRGLPPFGSADVVAAEAFASSAGLHHRVSGIDYAQFFQDTADKNALTGFQSDELHWYLPFARSLSQDAEFVMDGLVGDTLLNNVTLHRDIIPLLRTGSFDEAAERMVGRGQSLNWLSPTLRRRWSRERACHRLQTMLRSIADAPNPAKELHLWNKARRSNVLAPLSLYKGHLRVALPYTDPDILAISRSLPFEEHGELGQHDEIISGLNADLAHVPFETRANRCRLSAMNDALLKRSFLHLRRDFGAGSFEYGGFVQPRLLQLRLGGTAMRAFWWMVSWAHLRGLERAMSARGLSL